MRERNHPPLQFNVFISSKDDLLDERAAAEAAVHDLDLAPVRVETSTWLASPIPDEYLRRVRRSQLVVLILAPVDTVGVGKDITSTWKRKDRQATAR